LHATAWRRPSRIAVSSPILPSSSTALAASICRSMRGWPSGANMRAISSRENPAAYPSRIRPSRCSTPASNTRRRPRRPVERMSPFSS